MATVVTVNSITSTSDKSHDRPTMAASFDKVVLLYWFGAFLALLPVFGGNWTLALVRLGLVTGSVGLYFFISRYFTRLAFLNWLVITIIGVLTLISVVGTAQINPEQLRLSGFNAQVYNALSFVRRLLPTKLLPNVNQNVLGGLLVTFLPLAIAYALWGLRWWLRLYGLACATLVGVMLVATASRGALIGLAAALLVFVWFWLARYPRLRLGFFIILSLAAIPALVYLMADFLPQVQNGTSRLQLWGSTARLIGDYPFTGAGLGQFEQRITLHSLSDKHAHNLYLQSWVEFGLCGIVAMLGAFYLTLRLLITYRDLRLLDFPVRPIVAGALAGQVALFANGLVEYGSWGGKFAPAFWVLPALLTACHLKLTRPTLVTKIIGYRKLFWRNKVLPSGAVLLSLWLLLPLVLINAGSIGRSVGLGVQPLYQVAAWLAPWNATPPRNLGLLALERHDQLTAQAYYTTAFQRDADYWVTLMTLADLNESQGQHAQAIFYWRKAEAADYFVSLATQNIISQPASKLTAEQDLKLALEIKPDHQPAAQQLIGLYNGSGRKSEAQALLQQLIAQNPGPALLEQAASMAATPPEAVTLLQQAIKADPSNAGYIWELGNAYASAQQQEQAEAAYKQARLVNPVDQRPVRSLGLLYLSEKQPQAAVTELETFIGKQFFIESPASEYVILSQAYLALNNYSAAVTAAQKATQYSPTRADAYLALGDAWRASGDKAQTRAAYQQVLQLEPNNNDARNRLEEISKNG